MQISRRTRPPHGGRVHSFLPDRGLARGGPGVSGRRRVRSGELENGSFSSGPRSAERPASWRAEPWASEALRSLPAACRWSEAAGDSSVPSAGVPLAGRPARRLGGDPRCVFASHGFATSLASVRCPCQLWPRQIRRRRGGTDGCHEPDALLAKRMIGRGQGPEAEHGLRPGLARLRCCQLRGEGASRRGLLASALVGETADVHFRVHARCRGVSQVLARVSAREMAVEWIATVHEEPRSDTNPPPRLRQPHARDREPASASGKRRLRATLGRELATILAKCLNGAGKSPHAAQLGAC